MSMTADGVLAALDPDQQAVATAVRGPVVVLAGAGTGKTRAVTHRIAYGVLSGVYVPQEVLAVTFTARAAGEMRSRLRALGVPRVQARTFHAAALRQLQYFWPRVVGGGLPPLAAAKAPLLIAAWSRVRPVHAEGPARPIQPGREEIRDLAAEIEWVKVSQVHREDYPMAAAKAGRLPPAGLDAATVTRLLGAYEEIKRDRSVIDFEDVLVYAVGLLADRADVAEQVRSQYRHFVVDEYQDVNPLQHQLLELWRGDRDDLCVVGDASQTIYSFAGASPDYLLGFRRRFPAATEVRLVRDYRSTPQVVSVANALLARAGGRNARFRLQLQAQRPDGPPATFREFDDEVAEAEGVALRVGELIESGVPAREIAVLFRVNAQSEAYEQALADAGVPYVVRGGERFFDRREIREARLLMRGAAASADGPLPDEVRAVLAGVGWAMQPPTGWGATRDRWESLAALVRLAEEVAAARPNSTLREFLAELDERAAAQHAPVVDGVTLASLHAAKGLEWDAVFLVGLVEGTLPIIHAEGFDAVEEERRLLYVGITRARVHLALSWALARSPGGRAIRRPSRFVVEVSPGWSAETPRPQRRAARAGRGPALCRSCGHPLRTGAERKVGRCESCPASYDEALFERLRQWRRDRAEEQSVPAYVVFTDATLIAIAEARPTNDAELVAIAGIGATKLERYGRDVLELCGAG